MHDHTALTTLYVRPPVCLARIALFIIILAIALPLLGVRSIPVLILVPLIVFVAGVIWLARDRARAVRELKVAIPLLPDAPAHAPLILAPPMVQRFIDPAGVFTWSPVKSRPTAAPLYEQVQPASVFGVPLAKQAPVLLPAIITLALVVGIVEALVNPVYKVEVYAPIIAFASVALILIYPLISAGDAPIADPSGIELTRRFRAHHTSPGRQRPWSTTVLAIVGRRHTCTRCFLYDTATTKHTWLTLHTSSLPELLGVISASQASPAPPSCPGAGSTDTPR